MWKGVMGTSRCGTINYEDSTILGNVPALQPSSPFCSRVLTGRPQRSDFSGRSLAPCVPRYWTRSRYRLPPSVRLGEPWGRLKGHRVAGAVIEAGLTMLTFPYRDFSKYVCRFL